MFNRSALKLGEVANSGNNSFGKPFNLSKIMPWLFKIWMGSIYKEVWALGYAHYVVHLNSLCRLVIIARCFAQAPSHFCGSFLYLTSRMSLINSWMHLAVFEWAEFTRRSRLLDPQSSNSEDLCAISKINETYFQIIVNYSP